MQSVRPRGDAQASLLRDELELRHGVRGRGVNRDVIRGGHRVHQCVVQCSGMRKRVHVHGHDYAGRQLWRELWLIRNTGISIKY